MNLLSKRKEEVTIPTVDSNQQLAITTANLRYQIKRINLYLLSLLAFLIVFNFFNLIVGYSQSSDNNLTKTQEIEQNVQNRIDYKTDLLTYIFDNSIASMVLSTFIIAIIGVLITKLRNFKKKLDMIEILTKALARMKQQANDREVAIQTMFTEYRKEVKAEMNKIDDEIKELEKKIEEVKEEATNELINYLKRNSFDRKRG